MNSMKPELALVTKISYGRRKIGRLLTSAKIY